jgi:hypothetical protein
MIHYTSVPRSTCQALTRSAPCFFGRDASCSSRGPQAGRPAIPRTLGFQPHRTDSVGGTCEDRAPGRRWYSQRLDREAAPPERENGRTLAPSLGGRWAGSDPEGPTARCSRANRPRYRHRGGGRPADDAGTADERDTDKMRSTDNVPRSTLGSSRDRRRSPSVIGRNDDDEAGDRGPFTDASTADDPRRARAASRAPVGARFVPRHHQRRYAWTSKFP